MTNAVVITLSCEGLNFLVDIYGIPTKFHFRAVFVRDEFFPIGETVRV